MAQRILPALLPCLPLWTAANMSTVNELIAEHAELIELTADLYERPLVPDGEDRMILGTEPQPRSYLEALLVVLAVIGLLARDALTTDPTMTMATAWAKSRIALLDNFQFGVGAIVPVLRLVPMASPAIEILQRSASRWLADVFILDFSALQVAATVGIVGYRSAVNRWRKFASQAWRTPGLIAALVDLVDQRPALRPMRVDWALFELVQGAPRIAFETFARSPSFDKLCGMVPTLIREQDVEGASRILRLTLTEQAPTPTTSARCAASAPSSSTSSTRPSARLSCRSSASPLCARSSASSRR